MCVSMGVTIDQFALRAWRGNLYYVCVCQRILLIVQIRNRLIHHHQNKNGCNFLLVPGSRRQQQQRRRSRRLQTSLQFSPVQVVQMVITQILSIAINFIIVERVQSSIDFVECNPQNVVFSFLLGWHSVMECEKGLAYSVRDHDCVPIELANCTIKKSSKN